MKIKDGTIVIIIIAIVILALWWVLDANSSTKIPPVASPTVSLVIYHDSIGVDTDGDGTIDNYLYSNYTPSWTIQKGANITLTVTGDTILIASATPGTSDSMGVDTDGDGTVDNYLYSTSSMFAMLREGTGITFTVDTDTLKIETTLGTTIVTGEITDQTIVKADIDSTASNFIFDDAYRGTSAEAGSVLVTKNYSDLNEAELTNSAGLAAALDDESGTGTVAFTTSPTFVTPTLGAATATSYDGVAAANLLDKSATEAITGAWDFGGATSLEIPAIADPTTNAEGEIAWDANDDAIEVYMGDESESALIPAYQTIDALIFAPDGVNDAIPLMHVDAMVFPFGIELDQLSIGLPADAAYEMAFEEWAGDPIVLQNAIDTVITGAADGYMEETAITDAAIDADDYIYISIPATDVDWVHVQIIYHINDGN